MKNINLKLWVPIGLAVIVLVIVISNLFKEEDKTLNIVSWGGAYSVSQDEAYNKPFTKNTGVKIQNIDKGSAAAAGVRSQVNAGNITWDIVDVTEANSARLCNEGLVEEIDYDKLLAKGSDGSLPSEDFVSGLSGCFIPTIVVSTTFAFNKEVFRGKVPSSIKDVFNLRKFKGKRGLEKQPFNNLEWALIADGVSIKNIYKVLSTKRGVNRAFKKLNTIKTRIVWWTAGAQPPQLLVDKEVSISSGYNGRFFSAIINEKQPLEIMWTGQSIELDGWVIPKGKLTDTVKDYLYFATDSQRLADQAKYISYGPARKSSAPLVSTHAETGVDMKPHMPTSPQNMKEPFFKNAKFWTDNGEDLIERFNSWLAN